MSAQKWSPFKAHSIPCLGDSVNLSGSVVFKVGDSAPSWYLGWHRKMLKLLSHRKTPFDASFSWTSHMGQERRKSACLSSYHWPQHISDLLLYEWRKGPHRPSGGFSDFYLMISGCSAPSHPWLSGCVLAVVAPHLEGCHSHPLLGEMIVPLKEQN